MKKPKEPPAKFGSGQKAKIADFRPKLQGLCAATLADNRSREDGAEMIESQIAALGFTIAMVCEGNPKAIDEMLHGVNAYLIEVAANHRKAGSVMGQILSAFK